MIHRKILAAVGVTTLAVSAFGTTASADNIILRIGSGHPSKPVPYVRKMEHYFVPAVTKRVKAETKHTVKFIQAYAGTVAKVHETLEAVEKGLLDIEVEEELGTSAAVPPVPPAAGAAGAIDDSLYLNEDLAGLEDLDLSDDDEGE